MNNCGGVRLGSELVTKQIIINYYLFIINSKD